MTDPLVENAVDLWLCRVSSVPDSLTADYEALLSAEESARYHRFLSGTDRRRHLVTRALVRTSLSHYMDQSPAAWAFGQTRHGRPTISTRPAPALDFNLSHSGDWIACLVGCQSVLGVDIEQMERQVSIDQVARRQFTAEEIAELGAAPDPRRHFFELWTLKEAYLKARGWGLSVDSRRLAISRRGGAITIRFDEDLDEEASRWQLDLRNLDSRHILATAILRSSSSPIQIRARETIPLQGD